MSYADHWNAQIARGRQLIARDIAEPAGVDRERFAQHELPAEICDAGEERVRMRLLKPRRRPSTFPARLCQVIDALAENEIIGQSFDPLPRYGLQYAPWIARELPQHRIELPPHIIGSVTP
jgi:hypothetical protein